MINTQLKIVLFAVITVFATGESITSAANTLSEAELADGWILLFDGESLFGWQAQSSADWQVADGTLSASQGESGLLLTNSQFGDYQLTLDFRIAAGGNSGVFLHTIPKPARTDLRTGCYEINIAGVPEAEWPTGSLVDRMPPGKMTDKTSDEDEVINRRRQFIEQQYPPPSAAPLPQWQTLDITLCGGRLTVEVDGRSTVQYVDARPLGRGPIGLQFRTGKIEFRNIKLRPLGLEPIFNGRDLSGWAVYPDMPAEFSVTPEGWLHVRGGKGQLESAGRYGDFTLQLETFVAAPESNSGVFFRCIPGEYLMGYESQIHNGFLDGDRTKPADCGTGGIFRRQNARKIVADDRTWFAETINVVGPHVAVWVNGYQVTDWTDQRPPHDNPRKGLRLAPGTIALQAHDPSTDLLFRNLRIAELPPR